MEYGVEAGDQAERKAAGLVNQVNGLKCYSQFSWKPWEGCVEGRGVV